MSEIIVNNTTDEPDYIRLTYKGEETYTLQFSRATALFAQQKGFNPSEIDIKPAIVVPDLFYYAMRKNHLSISREKVDRIREKLFPNGLPIKVIKRLAELYDIACSAQVIDLDSVDSDEIKNADTEVEM